MFGLCLKLSANNFEPCHSSKFFSYLGLVLAISRYVYRALIRFDKRIIEFWLYNISGDKIIDSSTKKIMTRTVEHAVKNNQDQKEDF